MRRFSFFVLLILVSVVGLAFEYSVPKPILPESLKWGSPPNNKLFGFFASQ